MFTRPAGYVSVNATPVTATALVLPSVSVRTEVAPRPTAAGENALASVGCASTVRVAAAPEAVPALAVVTLPVLLA